MGGSSHSDREGVAVTSLDIFDTLEKDDGKSDHSSIIEAARTVDKTKGASNPSVSSAVKSASLRIELQSSTSYFPLPVTDIMISSLGLYFAYVYAKQHIVVHEWETHKAVHQVSLDDGLVDVSLVPCGEPEDLKADFLVLGLQGSRSVKLLDAISGSLVYEHTLRMPNSYDPLDTPQQTRLWCSALQVRKTRSRKALQYKVYAAATI